MDLLSEFSQLEPENGRISCPVDRNLEIFLTSHIDFLFIFDQCGDNKLYIKSVSEKKSGGHRTSKIVKSRQSPIIVHFSTWRARDT